MPSTLLSQHQLGIAIKEALDQIKRNLGKCARVLPPRCGGRHMRLSGEEPPAGSIFASAIALAQNLRVCHVSRHADMLFSLRGESCVPKSGGCAHSLQAAFRRLFNRRAKLPGL